MTPVITLTTDFGLVDTYVGVMKGVILGINPRARIVDLTHAVRPQDIWQASFALGTAFGHFPLGSIHLAVVDPGVGSQRRALAVRAGGYYFVAPDNGLLSFALARLGLAVPAEGDAPQSIPLPPVIQAVFLTNPRFWLSPVSQTFHGRDIFSPVAAHLSLGIPMAELGEEVSSLLVHPITKPSRSQEGSLLGQVLYVDHFGNLVSNIKEEELPDGPVTVEVAGYRIEGLSRSYAEAKTAVLAIVGSHGYLEISAKEASAAARLGAGRGTPVEVRPALKGQQHG
jgi:hypothetical protein